MMDWSMDSVCFSSLRMESGDASLSIHLCLSTQLASILSTLTVRIPMSSGSLFLRKHMLSFMEVTRNCMVVLWISDWLTWQEALLRNLTSKILPQLSSLWRANCGKWWNDSKRVLSWWDARTLRKIKMEFRKKEWATRAFSSTMLIVWLMWDKSTVWDSFDSEIHGDMENGQARSQMMTRNGTSIRVWRISCSIASHMTGIGGWHSSIL